MQREIIKDLLGEKLAREQHQTELNDSLQRRLQETTGSQVQNPRTLRIRDLAALEQMSQMHDNIETVKRNLSEDTDYMTSGMTALLAKVDKAIRFANGSGTEVTTPVGEASAPQEQKAKKQAAF